MARGMNRFVGFIICLVSLAIIVVLFYFYKNSLVEPIPESSSQIVEPPTPSSEESDEQTSSGLEDDGLPHDKLFITTQRAAYKDADMVLKIPQLGVEEVVYNGTSDEAMRYGVGLYDYARLPGEGNRNVSLVGHRNDLIAGVPTDQGQAPFYYVDTLKEGDYFYLIGYDNIYRYTYLDTAYVEDDDWGPIFSQGFSCITLTSCHPIGISDQRIIVRGELEEILEYDEGYDYPAAMDQGKSENE